MHDRDALDPPMLYGQPVGGIDPARERHDVRDDRPDLQSLIAEVRNEGMVIVGGRNSNTVYSPVITMPSIVNSYRTTGCRISCVQRRSRSRAQACTPSHETPVVLLHRDTVAGLEIARLLPFRVEVLTGFTRSRVTTGSDLVDQPAVGPLGAVQDRQLGFGVRFRRRGAGTRDGKAALSR